MKNTYETFYPLWKKFNQIFHAYSVQKDSLDDIYYRGIQLLEEMSEKAHKNESFRIMTITWFKKGGTIKLMDILSQMKYDGKLLDWNAMARLDSCSLIK